MLQTSKDQEQQQQRESSATSGDSKTSLLPKTQNVGGKPTRVASNIFVEEPDVFLMPGHRAAPSAPAKTPDSPPLKAPAPLKISRSPPPKSLPFKPLSLMVPMDTTGPKTPPPVPPKTYVTAEEAAVYETAGVTVTTEAVEPKQSNVERAKIVHFHPDVKMEDSPPPLPQRGMVWKIPSTEPVSFPEADTFVLKAAKTIAMENPTITEATKTVAMGDSTVPKDTKAVAMDEGQALEEIVAIVDATSGDKVGELVPSPVAKTPPLTFRRRQTPPLVRQSKVVDEDDEYLDQ